MIDASEILTMINLGVAVVTLIGGVTMKYNDIKYLKKSQEKFDIKLDKLPCMIPRCPSETTWDGQERRKIKR